jgi:hypothetical protein
MHWTGIMLRTLASLALLWLSGCNDKQTQNSTGATLQPTTDKITKIDPPNELGFSKISIRDGDIYQEGVVDAVGKVILEPSESYLVMEIQGTKALVQCERKFLFVPLDSGPYAASDLVDVNGFQYAHHYRCGLAMVMIDDNWFYIDQDGKRAFTPNYNFAESFHHDRALVRENKQYRIINVQGETVADLNFDQVNLQSPYCWQVSNKVDNVWRHGFIDLNGDLITEVNFDHIGYYEPDVQRIRVMKDKRFGFVDDFAKVVIHIVYDYAEMFDRGKARVVLNGRTLFIDPYGKEVPE